MIAVGVASPIAHGQAITSTATALVEREEQRRAPGPRSHQAANVSAAMHEHDGHEDRGHAVGEALDRRREPCASSTSRMMRASVVSPPTRVARNTKLPVRLTVPPNTRRLRRLVDRAGSRR